jgi:hypothetical protein
MDPVPNGPEAIFAQYEYHQGWALGFMGHLGRSCLDDDPHVGLVACPLRATHYAHARSLAIVAIARKLLVVIWHVLTAHTADRQADPVAVARRLFRWGPTHHLATQSGLSGGGFVRRALEQIEVGHDLTHLAINGSTYVLRDSG